MFNLFNIENFHEYITKLYKNYSLYGKPIIDIDNKFQTNINRVVLPQYDFIYDNNEKLVDYVYNIKEVDLLINKLNTLIDVELSVPNKDNISLKKEEIIIDDKLNDMIVEMYHNDLKLFNDGK